MLENNNINSYTLLLVSLYIPLFLYPYLTHDRFLLGLICLHWTLHVLKHSFVFDNTLIIINILLIIICCTFSHLLVRYFALLEEYFTRKKALTKRKSPDLLI